MKYAFIAPRQSGKSTIAKYEFLKDPEKSAFITCKLDQIRNYDGLSNYKNNFYSQESFYNGVRGKEVKNVILDEYLFFTSKNREKMYNYSFNNVKDYYIFSTPNKLYDKDLFDLVKEMKSSNIYLKKCLLSKNDILNYIKDTLPSYKDISDNKLWELYTELDYNFLTDKDCIILDGEMFLNKQMIHKLIDHYNNDDKETQLFGKLFKETK